MKNLIPGILMIVLAFLVGAHKNAAFGLFGFLCFFVVGVTLIIESRKKL